MEALRKSFAILEARFGKIENVKFLVGEGDSVTKEQAAADVLKAAEAIRDGRAHVADSFPEPGLNDTRISILSR